MDVEVHLACFVFYCCIWVDGGVIEELIDAVLEVGKGRSCHRRGNGAD